MKEGVLDILIYLFENYFDADTEDGFEPDRETLKLELEKAGFPGPDHSIVCPLRSSPSFTTSR